MDIILHRVNNFQIGQRSCDGYINLTVMVMAGGKKLNDYLRLSSTKSFIEELSSDTGISVSELIQAPENENDKTAETWGHPQAAIHCSQWCSDKLAVTVGKWVFDWLTANQNLVKPLQSPDFSVVIKAFIQSSQALNKKIHTAIHQQTDSLREALKALEVAENLVAASGNLNTEDTTVATSVQFDTEAPILQKEQLNLEQIDLEQPLQDEVDEQYLWNNQQDITPIQKIEFTAPPEEQYGFYTNVPSFAPSTRQRKGCLYKYVDKKTLKNGREAVYPRVIGERDPNNVKHWNWGFSWEEKIDNQWRNRSVRCPASIVSIVIAMQNQRLPLAEIISFIKHSKQHVIQNYKFGLIVNE